MSRPCRTTRRIGRHRRAGLPCPPRCHPASTNRQQRPSLNQGPRDLQHQHHNDQRRRARHECAEHSEGEQKARHNISRTRQERWTHESKKCPHDHDAPHQVCEHQGERVASVGHRSGQTKSFMQSTEAREERRGRHRKGEPCRDEQVIDCRRADHAQSVQNRHSAIVDPEPWCRVKSRLPRTTRQPDAPCGRGRGTAANAVQQRTRYCGNRATLANTRSTKHTQHQADRGDRRSTAVSASAATSSGTPSIRTASVRRC
jgi:hypothetical protein